MLSGALLLAVVAVLLRRRRRRAPGTGWSGHFGHTAAA